MKAGDIIRITNIRATNNSVALNSVLLKHLERGNSNG